MACHCTASKKCWAATASIFHAKPLARWVIQCGEHLQPLLNWMRDRLLESRVIHCDEMRVQVMKEPGREPTSQSWMWVQTGGPPNQPVILFGYSTSRAQEVPSRLLESYRGYLMTEAII